MQTNGPSRFCHCLYERKMRGAPKVMETCLSCHIPIITTLAQPFQLKALLNAGIQVSQAELTKKKSSNIDF